jgi:hypothetical protein
MTMKRCDRKRLREILEEYDGNLQMFESLKADCYEQRLAAQSLDDLNAYYAAIFEPGAIAEKVAAKCPPWPEGTKDEGKPPQKNVVRGTLNRFKAEQGLAKLALESALGDACLKAVKALPEEKQLKLLDQVLTKMAHEVMAAKLQGVPVSTQLPPVDRLMARQKLAVRRGDLKVKRSRLRLEQRKVKVLEKSCEAKEKSQTPKKQITQEGMEVIERELGLH